MRRPRILAIVAVASLAAGCSAGAPHAGTIPSIDAAHHSLARLFTLAGAGDFDELGRAADAGNCERLLEDAGRDPVPPDPPIVVATRTITTSTSSGDQMSLGGVVFVLCGVDGHGNHYDSEMLVFNTGHGLGAINPIYWGTTRIGDSSNPVTQESFAPVAC